MCTAFLKTPSMIFDNNFCEYRPILKILSLNDFHGNSLSSCHHIEIFTSPHICSENVLANLVMKEFLKSVFIHISCDQKLKVQHELLGLHTYSVRAFCFSRRVCHLSVCCLSRIRSQKLSKIGVKFHHLYRKSGSPSKKEYDVRLCAGSN